MNHHPAIIKKIRKLMRLAKAKGPEGERAAERAKAMMERHGIDDLTVDERVRMLIPGVDGEFWKEQVLTAVATAAGVQVMQAERGGKKVAALQGERQDVEAAALTYQRVALEITRRCWKVLQRAPFGYWVVGPAEQLWCRIFHIGAASSVGEAVMETLQRVRTERKKQPAPGQPTIDEVPATPEERKEVEQPTEDEHEKRQRREKDRSERELAQLAELVGLQRAMALQEAAFYSGVANGKAIPLKQSLQLSQNGHQPEFSKKLLLTYTVRLTSEEAADYDTP